jgi:hypothetical protein
MKNVRKQNKKFEMQWNPCGSGGSSAQDKLVPNKPGNHLDVKDVRTSIKQLPNKINESMSKKEELVIPMTPTKVRALKGGMSAYTS